MIQEFSTLLCDGGRRCRMTFVEEREIGDVKFSQELMNALLSKLSRL